MVRAALAMKQSSEPYSATVAASRSRLSARRETSPAEASTRAQRSRQRAGTWASFGVVVGRDRLGAPIAGKPEGEVNAHAGVVGLGDGVREVGPAEDAVRLALGMELLLARAGDVVDAVPRHRGLEGLAEDEELV